MYSLYRLCFCLRVRTRLLAFIHDMNMSRMSDSSLSPIFTFSMSFFSFLRILTMAGRRILSTMCPVGVSE